MIFFLQRNFIFSISFYGALNVRHSKFCSNQFVFTKVNDKWLVELKTWCLISIHKSMLNPGNFMVAKQVVNMTFVAREWATNS